MNVYTQAISEQKRAANTQLVETVLFNKTGKTGVAHEFGNRLSLDGSQREPPAIVLGFAQYAASD